MTITHLERAARSAASAEVERLSSDVPMLLDTAFDNYRAVRFSPARAPLEDVPSGIYCAILRGPSSANVVFKIAPVTTGELAGTLAVWVTDPTNLFPNIGTRWVPIGTLNHDGRMYLWNSRVDLYGHAACKAIMITIMGFNRSMQSHTPTRRIHLRAGGQSITACFKSVEPIATPEPFDEDEDDGDFELDRRQCLVPQIAGLPYDVSFYDSNGRTIPTGFHVPALPTNRVRRDLIQHLDEPIARSVTGARITGLPNDFATRNAVRLALRRALPNITVEYVDSDDERISYRFESRQHYGYNVQFVANSGDIFSTVRVLPNDGYRDGSITRDGLHHLIITPMSLRFTDAEFARFRSSVASQFGPDIARHTRWEQLGSIEQLLTPRVNPTMSELDPTVVL